MTSKEFQSKNTRSGVFFYIASPKPLAEAGFNISIREKSRFFSNRLRSFELRRITV